jgi:hypothetical protein
MVKVLRDLYYLDLNLRYKCDSNSGNAKFDKSRKTLTIKLPINGLTEEAQKTADADYERFVQAEKEKRAELDKLQKSRLDDQMEQRAKAGNKKVEDEESDEDKENENHNFGTDGVSKPRVINMEDGKDAETLEDKYNIGKNREQL